MFVPPTTSTAIRSPAALYSEARWPAVVAVRMVAIDTRSPAVAENA